MDFIDGGVTAPLGFTAAGIVCGVKAGNTEKKDLAMILSECECSAAAVFTRNRVKAAPLLVSKKNLEDGKAFGIIANSGNANACVEGSLEDAAEMCRLAAQVSGLQESDFIVASTGVIGKKLNMKPIEEGIPRVFEALSRDGSDAAAQAIMTTDTRKKECAVSFEAGGCRVRIGGIAKGSGMIHPNMGTLLCFITTDCCISSELLQKALESVIDRTLNRVTIDGDTSTNDTCTVLANGLAGNPEIQKDDEDYQAFCDALFQVLRTLSRGIAADGEGASKLLTCIVTGAETESSAEVLAKAVVGSNLVKAAMFGADANWGRVLCAMGYSGQVFNESTTDISFRSDKGEIPVCRAGGGLNFDEAVAKEILSQDEVIIQICVGQGSGTAECWGCDLTYDYVKINGDYRT